MAYVGFNKSATLAQAKNSNNPNKLYFPVDSNSIVLNRKEYGGVTQNDLNSVVGDVEAAIVDIADEVETLRSEINSAQLAIGAVQTDAVPIQNSANHLTSGAIYTAMQEVTEKEIVNNDANPSLLPNNLYKLGVRSSLNVSLVVGTPGIVNEYMFEFTVSGDEFYLTLPNAVKWLEEPSFENGFTYQVSIVNNLAVAAGWENE